MIAVLLACVTVTDGPAEGQAYARALVRVREEPAKADQHCAPLRDDRLRGDCLTAGVEALAPRDPDAAAALCALVADGPWRDECYFQAAEKSDGRVSCDLAGRFAADCRMHRWGWSLGEILPDDAAPGGVEPALAAAMTDFGLDPGDDEPWWAVYRALLSRRQPLDRAACDAVAQQRLQRICRQAGLQLYGDWLNHARDTTGFPCDADTLTGRLAHAPDPEIDALLARRRGEDLCP